MSNSAKRSSSNKAVRNRRPLLTVIAFQTCEPAPAAEFSDADWPRNTYTQAREALAKMKRATGREPIFDISHDDPILSRLCAMTPALTRKLVQKHIDLHLGWPTEDSIDVALEALVGEGVIGAGTDSI